MEKRLHVPPAVRASGIKHLIHYVKNATRNNKKLFPNVRAVEFQWGFNKLCAGRNAPFVYLTDATWVGNPSGPTPYGPPPLQGGGVLPPDGQAHCCDGFQICRSISAGKHETVLLHGFDCAPLTEECHNRTSGAKTLAPPAIPHSKFKASLPYCGLVVACWARDAACEVVGAPACWGVLWPC